MIWKIKGEEIGTEHRTRAEKGADKRNEMGRGKGRKQRNKT
jgi:hypothetical protein